MGCICQNSQTVGVDASNNLQHTREGEWAGSKAPGVHIGTSRGLASRPAAKSSGLWAPLSRRAEYARADHQTSHRQAPQFACTAETERKEALHNMPNPVPDKSQADSGLLLADLCLHMATAADCQASQASPRLQSCTGAQHMGSLLQRIPGSVWPPSSRLCVHKAGNCTAGSSAETGHGC